MVRVLAIADEEVPTFTARVQQLRVDLVLVAGDLAWDYVEQVVGALDAPAAYVPGNHDPNIGPGQPDAPHGTTNVDLRVINLGDVWIGGLGGCVRYNDGSHQFTQDQFDERAARLADAADASGCSRIDVLLSHAPPYGLGDEPDPSHVGINALHSTIDRLRPTWHLHGHIHPYGMHKPDRTRGSTTIRNVIPWTVMDIEPSKEA